MSPTVLVQETAAGVTLVLNRPDRRNALSHALLVLLAEALESPNCSNSTKIILTGAGSSFSAGADAAELTGTIDDLKVDEDIARVRYAIQALGNVTALVNGPCMGGAVDIALACRDRVALPEALFQVPASKLSLLYNPSSVKEMVERYGSDLVQRILADGERFDAKKALEAGIVSAIEGQSNGPHAEHEPAATGPVAEATRKMIATIEAGEFDLDHWEQVRREFLSSAERAQAVKAFRNKMSSGRG
jgi:enoyl-CoA hydratase/carnithine racemase